ncbi:hypothetical protein NHQ30_007713 [Ciborinia camelliae]|nr:hypothetical protein NHQ30_007713 [Ciborinia camelliae]
MALVDLLRDFDIHPTTEIGHSSGEIAAVYTKGGMMSVRLLKDQIVPYLKDVSKQCGSYGLTVACINSSNNVTVSEDVDQISVLKDRLASDSVFTRKLLVDVAYHSPHMKTIADDYSAIIKDIEHGDAPPGKITMISSVTGKTVSNETLSSPDYWVLNLISPVQFVDAVQNLLSKSGQKPPQLLYVSMLVEVGPHSALQGPINSILNDARGTTGMSYISVLVRNNSAMNSLLNAVGQMKCLGYPVNMRQTNHSHFNNHKQPIALPNLPEYAFDHSKQYWFESRLSARYRLHHQGKLDLLGKPVPDWNSMEPKWRNILRLSEMPWMEDHVINGSMIYPGAGMVVMAIEAANQLSDGNVAGFELKEVSFIKPPNISDVSSGIETQLSLRLTQGTSKTLSGWTEFRLFTYEQDLWQECCHGFIRVEYESDINEVSSGREDIDELKDHCERYDSMAQSCQNILDPKVFYGMLGQNGLGFGPSFHRVTSGAYGNQNQVKGTIKLYEWPEREHPQAHFSENNNVHESAWTIAEDSLAVRFGVFSLNSSRHKILVQFEDLKLTRIGELMDDSNSSMISQPQLRAYNLDYRPDPELLSDKEIWEYCQQSLYASQTPFDHYIDMLGHKNSNLNILEISDEGEGPTSVILRTLSVYDDKAEYHLHTGYSSYCFAADIQSVLDRAKNDLENYPRLTFNKHLDMEEDPLRQGFEAGTYDVILAPMKLLVNEALIHRTRKMLKPVGQLMLYERCKSDCNGEQLMSDVNFNQFSKTGCKCGGLKLSASNGVYIQVDRSIPKPSIAANTKTICIISDPESSLQTESTNTLASLLQSQGLDNVIQATLFEAQEMGRLENTVFVILVELNNHFLYSLSQENYYLLKFFLISAPSILWVNSYGGSTTGDPMKPQQSRMSPFQNSPPLKMIMESPGLLDSFRFVEDKGVSRSLADDEVELQTQAIGMNLKDCLIALGQIPNGKLGQECAGIVTRTGSNTKFLRGDRIILIAYEGSRTFARGKANSASKIPHDMTFTTAAGLPAQFGTAWGVIHRVARLQSHKNILIHTAAGGTGQAATQVAKLIGATIFATVGSQSKNKILVEEYQLPEEHIFYSRDVSFAKGIKRLTDGRGVDVVLNSLVGDSLMASWECIAPFGRFVEIVKKDIMANSNLPMSLFAKNASFTGFDGNLWEQRSNDFELLINMFKNNTLHLPRPFIIHNLSQVEEVFNIVKDGKFAGKIVLEVTPDTCVPTILKSRAAFQLDPNATYVLAGGFGGIGRATSRWMVSRGAKNLILLSRSGPRTDAAYELLEELLGQGIRVETPACDITKTYLVHTIIGSLSAMMPPIKGCIQASLIANDGLFRDMEYDSWKSTVDCKTIGSWNLHSVLPSQMDFFILLASASGLGGLRGQANYNAANTYEDALARYRVSKGEKAISLDLGAMIDDGILAENTKLLDRVLTYGALEPITREKYFTLLDYYCNPLLPLLSPTQSQAAIGLGAGGGNGLESIDYSRSPLLYPLALQNTRQAAPTNGRNQGENREMIAASTSLDEAGEIVIQAIINKLAKSLSIMQDRTSIDTNKPLQMYGVDSLLAIELKNWIVKEFVAEIAVFETQGVSTLETLSRLVAGRSPIRHDKWTIWGDGNEE